MRSWASVQPVFVASGLDAGLLRPDRIVCNEQLGRPCSVEVDLVFPTGTVDGSGLVRKAGQVVFASAEDGAVLRVFAGVITKVREQATQDSPEQRLSVRLESPLTSLNLYTDYRIFQKQTTKDIVTACLKSCAVPDSAVQWRLSGSYPQREVCTQFGESTFAFVSRILEEDGIFYFCEITPSGPVVVFGDSDSAYTKTSPTDRISFQSTGFFDGELVRELFDEGEPRPAKVTLRDHDFKRPALDLEVDAESASPFSREHYHYPGRYVDPGEGKRRAQLRLDAFAATSRGVIGRGSVPSFSAGHTFHLEGAPDPSFDKEWVVEAVTHEWELAGEGSTVRSSFRLLPKEQQFRPMAITPRPVVPGPQTAVVTGPPGEEIHCDEFGRITVQFPWDRYGKFDDKSSCWVRVSQMHTSGSVAIPRVGWEVIVDFEDGDPDKPIVVGRVYNAKYPPPYQLPGQKTMSAFQSYSSPGGGGNNEIRLDDGAGSEEVNVHAQKDMNSNVANNKSEKVTTNATRGVKVDHTLKVGGNQTVSVSAKSKLDVGGAQKWTVGAARTVTVSGDDSLDVKGSRTVSIGASHTTLTPMSDATSTSGTLSETVGGSCLEVAAMGVSIAVAGSASVTVGAAKIEACATAKADNTIGARASNVGGAFINATGKDVGFNTKGVKATTVGGAWLANAGADAEFSAKSSINITVGGAVLMNATQIVLKVGGSAVTISAGKVVLDTQEIKLTASGPNVELAPMVGSK